MEKQTTQCAVESSPTWEHLETALRGRMREWLQALLDAEGDELLGRRKSARRKAVDSAPRYRSGRGKPRRLTVSCGTVTVRRPRVRGVQQRFRRLHASELMKEVHDGAQYVNGVRVQERAWEVAA